ncbi:MAG TPA: signal peptide peptidase SppA [Methyloceanibacter sp.]|nr:signal peptide peptidase SppA [Methyloceanibacter sp.]
MIEAETVIERRRLRRRLTAWRLAAVVLAVFVIALIMAGDQRLAGTGSFLPHIARVSVSGFITDDQKMLELLDKVGKSSQVRAVILDINSPGGTTTGGEAMYDAIRRLAEKKPVVAVCGTLATSAAYIVALATDRIFVYGNTITGSVGVIFQWADVSELMRTLGVKVEEVKSGPLKAVPNPFEPTDEKGRALAAEMVQEAKVWFVDLVGKRRNLEPAAVPGLTDGRVYSGRQALALKLVDEIGDERAAKRWLQKERDVTPGLSVVEWKPKSESGGIWGWLFGSIASSFGIAADNFVSLFGQVSEGLRLDGLVSLWHPAGS